MTYPYAYRILSFISMVSVPAHAMFQKGGEEKKGLAAALYLGINPYIVTAAQASGAPNVSQYSQSSALGQTVLTAKLKHTAGVYFKEIFRGKEKEVTADVLAQKNQLIYEIYKGELGLSEVQAFELLEFFKKHLTFQEEDLRLAAEISRETFTIFKGATPPGGPAYNQDELAALTIERYEKQLGFCTGKAIAIFKHIEEGKSFESGSLIYFDVENMRDRLPSEIEENHERLQDWVRQSPPPMPSMKDFMPDSSTSEELDDSLTENLLQQLKTSDDSLVKKMPIEKHEDEDDSDTIDMEGPIFSNHSPGGGYGEGTMMFDCDLD